MDKHSKLGAADMVEQGRLSFMRDRECRDENCTYKGYWGIDLGTSDPRHRWRWLEDILEPYNGRKVRLELKIEEIE